MSQQDDIHNLYGGYVDMINDPWWYYQGADDVSDGDVDMIVSNSDILTHRLKKLKRHEAAYYIDGMGWFLESYADSEYLSKCFAWIDAPQGYDFWEEIYWELLAEGWEVEYD